MPGAGKRTRPSSTVKPIRGKRKREEQRRLRELRDWRGHIERYEIENTVFGTRIKIGQGAYKREGPIPINLWSDKKLEGKIRHRFLGDCEKSEIGIISRELKIPQRIIERLWAREREIRLKEFSVVDTDRGPIIRIRHGGDKSSIPINFQAYRELVRHLKHQKFHEFTASELALISEKLSLPLWILKGLRKRELQKIRKGAKFIRKAREKEK